MMSQAYHQCLDSYSAVRERNVLCQSLYINPYYVLNFLNQRYERLLRAYKHEIAGAIGAYNCTRTNKSLSQYLNSEEGTVNMWPEVRAAVAVFLTVECQQYSSSYVRNLCYFVGLSSYQNKHQSIWVGGSPQNLTISESRFWISQQLPLGKRQELLQFMIENRRAINELERSLNMAELRIMLALLDKYTYTSNSPAWDAIVEALLERRAENSWRRPHLHCDRATGTAVSVDLDTLEVNMLGASHA